MTAGSGGASASRPEPRRPRSLPAWVGPGTRLVHGGSGPDPNAGSVVPSLLRYPADHSEAAERGEVHVDGGNADPTVDGPDEVIRELEGGEAARLFGSGLGAIASTALSLVSPGDEVVALSDLDGGTTEILRGLLPRFGVAVREISDADARAPETAVSNATRLVCLESPTNPLLRVHDIARWARAANSVGAILAVDNSLATPINQSPLALGADLVFHRTAEHLGGHSALLAGIVVGAARFVDQIDPKRILGSPLEPLAGFLFQRSLRTLGLRVARHNATGRVVADALAGHSAVARVDYPGRASEEDEAIAQRQMRGRGGIVTLSLGGGAPAVERFLRSLRIVEVAASPDGIASLASVPGRRSHSRRDPEERAARGIDEGRVRLSLGIEEPDDLVRDLTEALDAAR